MWQSETTKKKFEKSYQTTFVRPPHFTRLLPVVRSGTQLVAEWVEMYGKMREKKYWKIWIIKFIIREQSEKKLKNIFNWINNYGFEPRESSVYDWAEQTPTSPSGWVLHAAAKVWKIIFHQLDFHIMLPICHLPFFPDIIPLPTPLDVLSRSLPAIRISSQPE